VNEMPQSSSELELEKARRMLAAAEHLERGGFHEDAVSRAYYAVFHAACALLASIGRTVRTHDGLRAAVAEHFVRPGKLPARFGRLLARAAADRNDADYNSAATFGASDSAEAIEGAREALAAVEAALVER
jgi:uncharacterized protein (UPF0332 family)